MPCSIRGLIVGLTVVVVASAASAAPIYMDPNPVQLPSLDGTADAFTLSLLSGDTANHRLDFQLAGPGGGVFLPSVGASAIVFDDVILTGWGATSTSDMFFSGPASPFFGDPSTAGWLALDWLDPGFAEFYVEADQMFTTATVYSLSISFSHIGNLDDFFSHTIDRQRVRFSSSIPEPSAALVFAMGMLIAGRTVTQRRP
jgi:hypothetical protein